MPATFEFRPVANGLDYLESAIEHLQAQPTPRHLKYAVLHLQAAVEVLLKVRLMREHWALEFKEPSKANKNDFKQGNFVSISMDKTFARLKGIASIELSKPSNEHLKRLANERNKLQHFGLESQVFAVESIAGRALDTLLSFVNSHLIPGAEPDEQDELDKTQELIRKDLQNIDSLIKTRWERITPELDRFPTVITCPRCVQMAMRFDEEDFKCYFCDQAWGDIDAADTTFEYVLNVLEVRLRAVTRGEDLPIFSCPECGYDTFVSGVVCRSKTDEPVFACFNCKLFVDPSRIDSCNDCGKLIFDEEDSIFL